MTRQQVIPRLPAVACVVTLVVLSAAMTTTAHGQNSYQVTVRRTTAGVPHVVAQDFGSLGFGFGYVFAEDNLCLLLEEVVTVRGERSKFFGDQPYDLGNTAGRSNLNSDAVYRMLATREVADRFRASLDDDGQAQVRGYAQGVSRYVRELKDGQHAGRHERCRNEPWLRELSDEDIYLRFYKLNLLSSSAQFIDGIVAAQPPAAGTPAHAHNRSLHPAELAHGLAAVAPGWHAVHDGELGSNMYAFGRAVTDGGGMVFGNPHFPWYGGERLYQVHLTVPGSLDVQGASIAGVAAVNIGFTNAFAWSHTISYAHRFTPYAITLKPSDPFTYLQDGQEKRIEAVDIGVEVLRDGALHTESIRLYRSEYGPMVYLGDPALAWGSERAITLRDANAENFRAIRQYLRWNRAASLEEFARIQREELATPWVNTVAADRDGKVYYADMSVVPNVPDELAARCAVPGLSELVDAAIPRLPLLDGSRAECAWRVDPEAPQSGAMGASQLPLQQREDWAVNCNDSHWLTNSRAPLTGFARIIGDEAYPQSLRTRLCHQQVLDRREGRDGLSGNLVTHESLEQIALGSRIYSAELEKKALLEHVCQASSITFVRDPLTQTQNEQPVEVAIQPACSALAAWDDRNNVDSRGSLLWDELWFRIEALRSASVNVYNIAFDARSPIDTPRELDLSLPEIAQAFAAAVHAVQQSGFAVDAPRGDFSFREVEGECVERIPLPGGYQRVGAFTVAQAFASSRGGIPNLRPDVAYGPVRWGNSYLQVVSYPKHGSVRASTFVTYGQSSDPASPHYQDYTRRYADKQWVHASFTDAEVSADALGSFELSEPVR